MWSAKKLYYRGNDNFNRAYHGDELVWEKQPLLDYLTFEYTEAGGISMTNYIGNTPNIEYSKNGGAWTVWDYNNIEMGVGDKIKFKGNNPNGFNYSYKYSKFVINTGSCKASGNIMSLIDGLPDGTKIIPTAYCLRTLFNGCTALTTAPELPATTLTDVCYSDIFWGCSNLTAAPELPATTLANLCYVGMFWGCSGLTAAPELPATTLVNSCYAYMFTNCTSLTSVKCLVNDLSAYQCLYEWLNGVSSTGTFTKKAGVNWPRGINGIPNGWTVIEV